MTGGFAGQLGGDALGELWVGGEQPPGPPPPPVTLLSGALQVQAAFGCHNPWKWATASLTDITPWVTMCKVRRGRQHELDRFDAGTIELELLNQDGRFSPWNTVGPYSPDILDGVPMVLTALWQGVTYPIFVGFLDDMTPKSSAIMGAELTIKWTATDAFKLLNLGMLDGDWYQAQLIYDGVTMLIPLTEGGKDGADATNANVTHPVGTNPAVVHGGMQFVATTAPPGMSATNGHPLSSALFQPGTRLWTTETLQWADAGPPGAWSFDVWMKTDATSGSVIPLFQASAFDGTVLSFSINETDQLVLAASGFTSHTWDGLVNGASFRDGNWHYIGISVQQSGGALLLSWQVDTPPQPATDPGGSAGTASFSASARGWVNDWGNSDSPTILAGPFGVAGTSHWSEAAWYNTALSVGTLSNHQEMGANGVPLELSSARIKRVLQMFQVPAGAMEIHKGQSEVQPPTGGTLTLPGPNGGSSYNTNETSALAFVQQVELTEQGYFFTANDGTITFRSRYYTIFPADTDYPVIANNGVPHDGTYPMLPGADLGADDKDLWNDVQASTQKQQTNSPNRVKAQGQEQRAKVGSSITKYGKRSLANYDSMLYPTDAEADELANFLVNRYSTPQPRIRSVTLSSNYKAGAAFPLMLSTELLDIVEVVWQPQDGSTALDLIEAVEGIEHEITPGEWRTTFRLAPQFYETWLVLNDPVRGQVGHNECGF